MIFAFLRHLSWTMLQLKNYDSIFPIYIIISYKNIYMYVYYKLLINIKNYKFINMYSNKFLDFLMIFKILGMTQSFFNV